STTPLPPAPPTTTSDPLGLVKELPKSATTPPTASDPLAKFDRILSGNSNDPLGKSTARLPETAALPPLDATPSRPLVPRPPPREVDVNTRLADPLPGIETAATPLAEFVQTMSDLSTIPITLDVPFIPVTADTTVSLRMTNTTVGDAITDALKSLPVR